MAPTIAGVNCLTRAEDAVVETIANSNAFQAMVAAADAAEAKERIYVDHLPNPNEDRDEWTREQWDALFPLAGVLPPDDDEQVSFLHYANGSGFEYATSLAFHIRFVQRPNPALDIANASREFKNTIGTIAEEMLAQSYTPGRFKFTKLAPAGIIMLTPISQVATLGDALVWTWRGDNTIEA